MRTGDFSQLLPGTVIRDPANNQPFGGNQIPANRLDSIAKGLLEFFPAPNVSGAGLVNNYLALDSNTTDKDQFTQRIDFAESSNAAPRLQLNAGGTIPGAIVLPKGCARANATAYNLGTRG